MKHFLKCPICECLHEFIKSNGVIAFACEFLGGVIHFDFHSKEDIEEHKKESEPRSWKNVFKKRKEANNGS